MYVFDEFLNVFDFRAYCNDRVIDDLLTKIKAKVGKEVDVVNKTIELKGI